MKKETSALEGVDIELIKSGQDEGKYRVRIGGKRIKGCFTMDEVMSIIAGKEKER